MRITRCYPAVLLVLVAACAPAEDADDAADAPPAAEPAPAAPAAAPEAAITADVKGEGVTGNAKVTPSADGFELALTLSGAPAGPHAWHIHQGACGTSGAPIVVALSEKPNMPAVASELQVAADGTANATAQVPGSMVTVDQLKSGDYSLHVHKTGGAQHGPSIACADL
jgi:Cu/Zn superoxide dismutase